MHREDDSRLPGEPAVILRYIGAAAGAEGSALCGHYRVYAASLEKHPLM
jgi:hypothetical protein